MVVQKKLYRQSYLSNYYVVLFKYKQFDGDHVKKKNVQKVQNITRIAINVEWYKEDPYIFLRSSQVSFFYHDDLLNGPN